VGEKRFQRYEQGAWRRINEDKHIDIPCGERLSVETGGRGSPDGILPQGSFLEELLQDIADGLHDFLTSSSWRVSWMNLPMSSIFSPMGRDRCFSLQFGIPREFMINESGYFAGL
jgi:hypothetical protein